MVVPISEVGYTSATNGRGDHEVHKGHAVALGNYYYYYTTHSTWRYNLLFLQQMIQTFLKVFRNNVFYNGCNNPPPRRIFVLSLTSTQRWHSENTGVYLRNRQHFVAVIRYRRKCKRPKMVGHFLLKMSQ
jgi:hypothetical protein